LLDKERHFVGGYNHTFLYPKQHVIFDERFQVAGFDRETPVGHGELAGTDDIEASTVCTVVGHDELSRHRRWPGFVESLAAPFKVHARLVTGWFAVRVRAVIGREIDSGVECGRKRRRKRVKRVVVVVVVVAAAAVVVV